MKPPSVLIMGRPGSGKSWAITTAIEAGLDTFVIVTEPNGMDSVLDAMEQKKLPIEKLHWHYIQPVAAGWEGLLASAKRVNISSYEDISNLKQGIEKSQCTQFIELLNTCQNFIDDRTGEAFGNVSLWDASRCLVLDSLSGLNEMAWTLTVGLKPAAHMGEWGVAMDIEKKFLYELTSNLSCFFVLTAHVDREMNEVDGSVEKTIGALGKKNADKIARFFSEIVMAWRDKDGRFYWSTADMTAALKNRGLKFDAKIDPSLVAIFNIHQRRLAKAKENAA